MRTVRKIKPYAHALIDRASAIRDRAKFRTREDALMRFPHELLVILTFRTFPWLWIRRSLLQYKVVFAFAFENVYYGSTVITTWSVWVITPWLQQRRREASRWRMSPRGTQYSSWALRKFDFCQATDSPLPYCVRPPSERRELPLPASRLRHICVPSADVDADADGVLPRPASRLRHICVPSVDVDADADGAERVRVNSRFRPTNPIARALCSTISRGRGEARVPLTRALTIPRTWSSI